MCFIFLWRCVLLLQAGFLRHIVKYMIILTSYACIFISLNYGIYSEILNLSLPFLVFIFCVPINDKIISGRFDISYGIYIYAFPIQQIIINRTNLGFYTGMISSFILTSLLVTASWNLIEKRYVYRHCSDLVKNYLIKTKDCT